MGRREYKFYIGVEECQNKGENHLFSTLVWHVLYECHRRRTPRHM